MARLPSTTMTTNPKAKSLSTWRGKNGSTGSLRRTSSTTGGPAAPARRNKKTWSATIMTMANGIMKTCRAKKRLSVSVPISVPPRRNALSPSPMSGTSETMLVATAVAAYAF